VGMEWKRGRPEAFPSSVGGWARNEDCFFSGIFKLVLLSFLYPTSSFLKEEICEVFRLQFDFFPLSNKASF
jgi:hypothetical protein